MIMAQILAKKQGGKYLSKQPNEYRQNFDKRTLKYQVLVTVLKIYLEIENFMQDKYRYYLHVAKTFSLRMN